MVISLWNLRINCCWHSPSAKDCAWDWSAICGDLLIKSENWTNPPEIISVIPLGPFSNGIAHTLEFVDKNTIITVIDTYRNTLFTYKW